MCGSPYLEKKAYIANSLVLNNAYLLNNIVYDFILDNILLENNAYYCYSID